MVILYKYTPIYKSYLIPYEHKRNGINQKNRNIQFNLGSVTLDIWSVIINMNADSKMFWRELFLL